MEYFSVSKKAMRKSTVGLVLLVALSVYVVAEEQQDSGTANESLNDFLPLQKAARCTTDKCEAPNCRCSGLSLPKAEFRGHEKEIPQLVTLTFDDAVNIGNFELYEQLFDGIQNPDGCPARATYFVSHEYTDYTMVNALYRAGHEIALHSVTHGDSTDYWRTADVDLIMREFGQQMEMLVAFAKINRKHIRGMRLPFLQVSGNNSFEAAKRLGLLYDSSMPTQRYRSPAMWPYTLDYRTVQDCQIQPCPTASIPGFWVNPMVAWHDTREYPCSMIDGCIYPPQDDEDALFAWLMENFKLHYDGNRAPFGMYMHAAWFLRGKQHLPALRKFMLHLTSLPDVYFTTSTRVIQYMRHPVLGKPFKSCSKLPHSSCVKRSCSVRKVSTGEIRYVNVCDSCPSVYPWLDNPLGVDEHRYRRNQRAVSV